MDPFDLYAVCTSAWFAVQAIPTLWNTRGVVSTAFPASGPPSHSNLVLARISSVILLAAAAFAIASSNILPFTRLFGKPSQPDRASEPSVATGLAFAEYTPLLVVTAPLNVFLTAFYYFNYVVPGTSTILLWLGMFFSASLATLGGGLYIFGSGAGSDHKMRSHLMFETPKHRQEVKNRHAAKKIN